MIFSILNIVVESKVNKIRPISISFLTSDLKQHENLLLKVREGKDIAVNLVYASDTERIEQNIESIKKRITVDKQYGTLLRYFASDKKRLYMVNRNYLVYLKAILHLYRTSETHVATGVLLAPTKVYHSINATQESFSMLMNSLSLD
jgi:hypothetical protein